MDDFFGGNDTEKEDPFKFERKKEALPKAPEPKDEDEDDLDDFFSKNSGDFYFFTTKALKAHSDVSYPDGCYLFFGKETKGLPEKLLLKNKENCVRIPMAEDIRSLNLSNSVAIGVYEVLRQWNYPSLENFGKLHEYNWEDAE